MRPGLQKAWNHNSRATHSQSYSPILRRLPYMYEESVSRAPSVRDTPREESELAWNSLHAQHRNCQGSRHRGTQPGAGSGQVQCHKTVLFYNHKSNSDRHTPNGSNAYLNKVKQFKLWPNFNTPSRLIWASVILLWYDPAETLPQGRRKTRR